MLMHNWSTKVVQNIGNMTNLNEFIVNVTITAIFLYFCNCLINNQLNFRKFREFSS